MLCEDGFFFVPWEERYTYTEAIPYLLNFGFQVVEWFNCKNVIRWTGDFFKFRFVNVVTDTQGEYTSFLLPQPWRDDFERGIRPQVSSLFSIRDNENRL